MSGLLFAPAVLLFGGCGRDLLVEHAELRAQVESQAVLIAEMREVLEEAEKLEAEWKAQPRPALPVPQANLHLICEIVEADRERFEEAVQNGKVDGLYETFGGGDGKQVVTGTCRPSEEGLGAPRFEYSAFERKEEIAEYAPIASGDDNPVIGPQRVRNGLEVDRLTLEVLASRDGRSLVRFSLGAGEDLPLESYPLPRIYENREAGTLPMKRSHSASLSAEVVVPFGKPTFLGTLARAPESDDGKTRLVFLTLSLVEG